MIPALLGAHVIGPYEGQPKPPLEVVVVTYYMYVAAEGSREEGIARNELLRKEYPSHPAFRDVHNGMTETQRLLYKFQR